MLALAWDWTEAFSHLYWCFQHKSVTGPSRAALKVTARLLVQHLPEGIDWFFSKLHQSNLIKNYVLLGDVQLFFSWRLWSISRELRDLFAHCFSCHIEQNVGVLELSVERAVPWAVCRRGDGDGGFIWTPLCRVFITVLYISIISLSSVPCLHKPWVRECELSLFPGPLPFQYLLPSVKETNHVLRLSAAHLRNKKREGFLTALLWVNNFYS